MRNGTFSLYLVTDRKMSAGRSVEWVTEEAIRGGVTIVQLREKDVSFDEYVALGRRLKAVTDRFAVPLIINDRVDVALACGASGVHLGQDDAHCATARRITGGRLIIGVSVSSASEAIEAEASGADYLGVSPVFSTPTKTDAPAPTGLEGLSLIRNAIRIPVVGIGGISAHNAGAVIRSGADGVAVVSAIMASTDPCSAARVLLAAVQQAEADKSRDPEEPPAP